MVKPVLRFHFIKDETSMRRKFLTQENDYWMLHPELSGQVMTAKTIL